MSGRINKFCTAPVDRQDQSVLSLGTGGLIMSTGTDHTILPIGTDKQILTVDSNAKTGVAWKAHPMANTLTATGDLMTHSGIRHCRLPVSFRNHQYLITDDRHPCGLKWAPLQGLTPRLLADTADVLLENVQPGDVLQYKQLELTIVVFIAPTELFRTVRDNEWELVSGGIPSPCADMIRVGGTFYVVTTVHTVFSSSDAVTWTSHGAGGNLHTVVTDNNSVSKSQCIIHNGTSFVVGGRLGGGGVSILANSVDAVTWTPCMINGVSAMNSSTCVMSVAWNGTMHVAVAHSPMCVLTSPDGLTWTNKTDAADPLFIYATSSIICADITHNGSSTWVIVCNNTILTSTNNGSTWNTTFSLAENHGGIVHANGQFTVITNLTGLIYYSLDGRSWSQKQPGIAQALSSQGVAITDATRFTRITHTRSVYTIAMQNVPGVPVVQSPNLQTYDAQTHPNLTASANPILRNIRMNVGNFWTNATL